MTEVIVNQNELQSQIQKLASLSVGTRYRNTTIVVQKGYSDTIDALNELQNELIAIESVMMEIIEQTKQTMINAGVQFDEADWTAGQLVGSVGKMSGVI